MTHITWDKLSQNQGNVFWHEHTDKSDYFDRLLLLSRLMLKATERTKHFSSGFVKLAFWPIRNTQNESVHPSARAPSTNIYKKNLA